MITVKNSQLDKDTIEAINSLLEMNINATSAFKLMRIIKEISSLVEDKGTLERKIFDKYVEKDKDGNVVPVTDENNNVVPNAVKLTNAELFNKEMSELMNIENEISHDRIKFEDLGLETVKIKDIIKLEFLFD